MTAPQSMTLDEHLTEFKEQGFTLFPDVFDDAAIQSWKDKFQSLRDEGIVGHPQLPWWYEEMCERAPMLMLPVAAHPLILDFAEMVLGPFVQLDTLTLAGIPPVKAEDVTSEVSGWHRDRWSQVPQSTEYHHPLAINTLLYLNELTPESGPLRVLPGSHRRPQTVAPEDRQRPFPDEVLLLVKPGDVAVMHNGVLHSGSPNRSGTTRFLFSAYYQKSWLKPTSNYHGPNVEAIKSEARKRNDLRLLRLFGEDSQLQRANSGFTRPDEEMWREWAAADQAALKTSPES